ncbi:MAG: OmpA family protein [Candidatus Omnitrophota bacterium]
MRKYIALLMVGAFVLSVSGCAVNLYKGKPTDKQAIKKLATEVQQLQKKQSELEEAKALLESRLQKELKDKGVLLELNARGLVITMTNDILFDSGKAKLKESSHQVLDKVADVIKIKLPQRDVGVEGHTDNEPIKHSGWKSNWELSTNRATNVLHYLIENAGMDPRNLAAIGYGENRPIASNDTKEGRSRNRRVEIIILPKEITKRSYETSQQKISKEARDAEESRIK